MLDEQLENQIGEKIEAEEPKPGTEAYYDMRFEQRQKKWEENKRKQKIMQRIILVAGGCGIMLAILGIILIVTKVSEKKVREEALANTSVSLVEDDTQTSDALNLAEKDDLAVDIPEEVLTGSDTSENLADAELDGSAEGATAAELAASEPITPEIDADGNPLPLEMVTTDRTEVLPAVNTTFTKAEDYSFVETDNTSGLGSDQVLSDYAILLDVDNGTIVRSRDGKTRINPASMTKIMTILVAAERVTNLDDTFEITLEVTDFSYVNDCSNAGFDVHEVVTVRDLMYGTILPSGGDAAYALALYVAGSQPAFVELMNAKLRELGLDETAHFTNCVGLYDENHYCTPYDMGVILRAAMENPLSREILSTHFYKTTATPQHPEGIDLSNWFLRRIEDRDCGGTVVGAKTGYVVQSGNCAASFYTAENGSNYICVTAKAGSSWKAIYDHVAIYNIYVAGNTNYVRGKDHQ